MYLENIILQVTNTNTWKISPKDAFRRLFAQRNKGDAHQLDSNRAKHHGEAIQVQPKAFHAKAVVRRHGHGAADPLGQATPCRRCSTTPSTSGGMPSC